MVSRYTSGTLRGHRTGRGGRPGAPGLLRAGSLCHFFVRSRFACVVPPLLWCALRAPVVWLRCSQTGEYRGAWAWLIGWLVAVSGAVDVAFCFRGGGGGL